VTSPEGAAGLDGIVNVDKPRGLTSHDVVNRVRKILDTRRVGHAGTLDPLASGVLLVCVGRATRVSDYLMDGTKVYRATIRFGAASTTDDAEGELTPVPVPPDLDEGRITAAAASLTGDVDQFPPAYSAIKVDGTPLYRRARAGEVVRTVARRVHVERIDLRAWRAPDATVEIICSKGTYIRAIARDLGKSLQTAAYLTELTRLASGDFRVEEAIGLDELARASRRGYVDRLLYPIDVALGAWPALVLADDDVRTITQGGGIASALPTTAARLRAYDRFGRLVALLAPDVAKGGWSPRKVLTLSG
jgi:tRNA pseudouridine55 synthase